VADKEFLEARDRARALLADVAEEGQSELIFSLLEAEDQESWLTEQLANAVRD
jgi:hypothetical protein